MGNPAVLLLRKKQYTESFPIVFNAYFLSLCLSSLLFDNDDNLLTKNPRLPAALSASAAAAAARPLPSRETVLVKCLIWNKFRTYNARANMQDSPTTIPKSTQQNDT